MSPVVVTNGGGVLIQFLCPVKKQHQRNANQDKSSANFKKPKLEPEELQRGDISSKPDCHKNPLSSSHLNGV